MTKMIRVENADTSSHKVRLVPQYRDFDGTWVDAPVEIVSLDFPCQMEPMWIHANKRYIIEEVE